MDSEEACFTNEYVRSQNSLSLKMLKPRSALFNTRKDGKIMVNRNRLQWKSNL